MALTEYGDLTVTGRITANAMTIPSGTVTNDAVASNAAIAASKLAHRHVLTFAEGSGTTATTKTVVLHVVRGATATLKKAHARIQSACTGAATVVVDFKIDGVSCLSSTITLNSSTLSADGTITTTSAVATDVLTAVITVTTPDTSVAGAGVFVELEIDEDYPA